MCDPVLGLQIAGAALGYQQTRQAFKANAQAAAQEAVMVQSDLNRQAEQQRAADAQAVNEHARQALADMALFDASREGAGGASAQRRVGAAQVQNGETLATLQINSTNKGLETIAAGDAAVMRANNRIAALQKPSLASAALKIGSAYVDYNTRQAAGKVKK